MVKRPKIPVNLTAIDYIIEITGAIGIAILIFLPIYFYHDLPGQIPKHFNMSGQLDAYGNRSMIWLLPAVGLVLYVGITILNKFPFVFNYPVKVTNENAERLYTLATRTLRLLKVIIIFLFAFLSYSNLQIAMNKATGIENYYLLVFLFIVVILIGTMVYRMTKK